MSFWNDFSSGVGALGGVASLAFGPAMQEKQAKRQLDMQMKLNAQQQMYARENALTAYNRQRDLTRDSSVLQKIGRQRAGLSTAGDFGGSVASVSPIAPPSSGSAPSLPDPNASMLAGIQAIQASANSLVQNRTALAQAEGQELQNEILKKALPQKVAGAQGEGMTKYAEGKKATATLPTDIQQSKDQAKIKNNELWKSENDAAFAASNALSTSNALLAESLKARELYEQAKADKSMKQEQLDLFKDTYEFSVQAAQQNVINLRKQGEAIDASADASRASAEASRASAKLSNEEAIRQSIDNAIYGDKEVQAAARKELINKALQAGPQSFGEYAWSIINDPHATTAQKWKAAGASILGFFERSIGGASQTFGHTAGKNLGNRIVKKK